MEHHIIDYSEAFNEFKKYTDNYESGSINIESNGYKLIFEDHEDFFIPMSTQSNWSENERNEINKWCKEKRDKFSLNNLIFGKDCTTHIVSCEVNGNNIELFIEKDGIITSKFITNRYWIISSIRYNNSWLPLSGNLYYKFIKFFDNEEDFRNTKRHLNYNDIFSIADSKESAMVLNGFTYYKGMKVEDVSILSFDIESTGLNHDDSSRVLLISNTFKKHGVTLLKLFSCDEYLNDKEMIDDWCKWVREVNPSIMCGHNIFGYDLGYMNFCALKNGTTLALGRDESDIKFNKYPSKFRKDGSQDYEYYRAFIYGREIVDTMYLAYHFDFARKYDSYGLKQIIKQEGLEVKGRQFYDASNIWKDWDDLDKRSLIKKYAEHDADDALALYSLMIPSYFYLSSYIPKSFQSINYTASGSQLNSFLVRSYLQIGHSIPKATEITKFEGAISFGVPGIYSNCFKLDFNAMYPNIIRSFSIYSPEKDPHAHLLKMTNYFTDYRLKNKQLYKETGNRYYYEMEQGIKIYINSLYGLMSAPGLNFNFPSGAAMVTKIGRELLKFTILWATGKEINYWLKLFNEKTGKEEVETTL